MYTKDKSAVEIFVEYRQKTLPRIIEQQRQKTLQQEKSLQPTESSQPEQSILRFAIEGFLDKCPRRLKSSRNR